MTDTPTLFCARMKSGGFTRTAPAAEVFSSLQALLPVDKLFIVLPHPDGKGYELLEAGTIMVDFQATTAAPEQIGPQSPSEPRLPPAPIQTLAQTVAANSGPSEPVIEPPIANPTTPEGYRFEPDTPPAKPQAVIAQEKGLIDKVVDMSGQAKKKLRKANGKAKTPPPTPSETDQCSDDPNDTTWLQGVPPPVRVTSPGVASVTHITTATPEQAAAASIDLEQRRTY